jgi:hypothetical protein
MRAAVALGFAPPPGELAASSFDSPAGALRPYPGNRAGLKALDTSTHSLLPNSIEARGNFSCFG